MEKDDELFEAYHNNENLPYPNGDGCPHIAWERKAFKAGRTSLTAEIDKLRWEKEKLYDFCQHLLVCRVCSEESTHRCIMGGNELHQQFALITPPTPKDEPEEVCQSCGGTGWNMEKGFQCKWCQGTGKRRRT